MGLLGNKSIPQFWMSNSAETTAEHVTQSILERYLFGQDLLLIPPWEVYLDGGPTNKTILNPVNHNHRRLVNPARNSKLHGWHLNFTSCRFRKKGNYVENTDSLNNRGHSVGFLDDK